MHPLHPCAMSFGPVQRAFADNNVKTELFCPLEAEPFPEKTFQEQYPGVFVTWKQASDPMQVPWQYVMLCELCLSAFCAPATALFPWNTLRVNPVIWWFLLHPGTFNTRLIIYVYAEAGIAITTASICFPFFFSRHFPFSFFFPCLFYCSVGRVGVATH